MRTVAILQASSYSICDKLQPIGVKRWIHRKTYLARAGHFRAREAKLSVLFAQHGLMMQRFCVHFTGQLDPFGGKPDPQCITVNIGSELADNLVAAVWMPGL